MLYFEWNLSRRNGKKTISFGAFGYRTADFDPEDAESLEALSDWQWEADKIIEISESTGWSSKGLREAMFAYFDSNKAIVSPIISRGGWIAFGEHESSVSVFPSALNSLSDRYYYELDVVNDRNYVEVIDDKIDNNENGILEKILNYERFRYPLTRNATFHLQNRGVELDMLYAPRWMICSARMKDLIVSETSKCLVFPIHLYRSKAPDPKKEIPGYYVVHIYEQLSCLDPADVRPAEYAWQLPGFDPCRGYRILRSKVKNKSIFRIAYEHRRLVVSSGFRKKCETLGLTGLDWLRRESI